MAALWQWEKDKQMISDLIKYAEILTGKAQSADGSRVGGELTGKYESNKVVLRVTTGILRKYCASKGTDAVADEGCKAVASAMLDVANAINNDLGGNLGKQQKAAVAGLTTAANAVMGGGHIEHKGAKAK